MDYLIDDFIGEIIEFRKAKNISQRALAYACNIPQSTIARIESGKQIPQIDTIMKIANALDLEIKVRRKANAVPEIERWNGLQFSTYWKNDLVAKVEVQGTEVDVTRFVLHPVKQIFYADRLNIFQLSQIFEDRCWEKGRADINEILRKLGLKYYDPLEIVKKTHGVSYNDFLWFQFMGENFRYEDIKMAR